MNIDEFNRKASKSKTFGRIKECFHHKKDECNGKVKQAHSIQRNGRLSIIESEVNKNLSVYCFTNFKSSEKTVMSELVPLGKKEASTFFGFCDYHDTNLFSPIENFPFDIESSKHLFLHSYRSFAHSYHKKKEELLYWSNFKESEFSTGSGFENIMQSQMKFGNEIALKELEKAKDYLDTAIENEDYDSLEYLFYDKEGLYPFAVSSQMSPKVTYKGISMNNHQDLNRPYENPIITFLPDKTSTISIIAVFPYEKKSVKLIEELDSLNDLQLEKAITSLIIANCENTIFSPLFWQSLSSKGKRNFLDEFLDNTNTNKYDKKWFRSMFNFFDDKYEMSYLREKATANSV